jgi:hypothetical protein
VKQVGTSVSSYRDRDMEEFIDTELQRDTLSHFKAGIINVIVATSVLEEGIDVAACNLVVCFEKPANLKAFVQRRGRARQRDSKLLLLLDSQDDKLSEWEQLELQMKTLYEDEMRVLQEISHTEDTEDHDDRIFRVDSTGATLDLDDAVQHLYHFCSILPAKEYVDLRPDFIPFEAGDGLLKARVILPILVHEAVRTAESRNSWKSEKNAIKDAAFEAYVALFNAGLVNPNLMPLLRHDPAVDELTNSTVDKRKSLMLANEQLDIWIDVAQAWNLSCKSASVSLMKKLIPIFYYSDHSYCIHGAGG